MVTASNFRSDAEAQKSTEKHKNPNSDPTKNNIVSKLPFLRVHWFLKLSPELLEAFVEIRIVRLNHVFTTKKIGRELVNFVTYQPENRKKKKNCVA